MSRYYLKGQLGWQGYLAVRMPILPAAADAAECCLQELWKARSRPKALDVDAIVPRSSHQANGLAGGHVPEAGVQPSACRSLGLSDQHKQWSLEENTKVGAEPRVVSGCSRRKVWSTTLVNKAAPAACWAQAQGGC